MDFIWVRGDIINAKHVALIEDTSTEKEYMLTIHLASGASIVKNFGDNKREYNSYLREFGNGASGVESTEE